MAKKEDRRVKMTKRLLKESLIVLLEQKSIGKITISEICEMADINRSTFYAHYSDQFDLLKSIEDEYITMVMKDLIYPKPTERDMRAFVYQLLQFFEANKAMSHILFSDRGDINFIKTIMELLYKELVEAIINHEQLDPATVYLTLSYVISGSAGIVQHWAKEDFKTPAKQVAEVLTALANSSIKSQFGTAIIM